MATKTPTSKAVLSGNEAIARGALEAGVGVATAYPGTPSTEILETLASVAAEHKIHAEWSTNEKVAFEVATAAALCGLRAIVSMKHPGVNWIADPLMAVNLSGVRGGLVIVACDDPGCHSSANEQDSRFYALFSETIVLEPSDPQEAKDMTKKAFEISERIELPVFIRSVTRVSHSKGDVILNELPSGKKKDAVFLKDPARFWISGKKGLDRHSWLHRQQVKIREIADSLPFSRIERSTNGRNGLCVAASGMGYSYVKEALRLTGYKNTVSILKIGSPYPLPYKLAKEALLTYKKILVIEEGEPFLELNLKVLSAENKSKATILGKSSGHVEQCGELNTEAVIRTLSQLMGRKPKQEMSTDAKIREKAAAMLPDRIMTFCSGCPHRSTLYALRQVINRKTRGKAIVVGDVGCYALSIMPPFQIGDVKYSMGASIGVASGLSHVLKNPIIALIGDSTFFHAGIPALINASYNGSTVTVIVLDNKTTGMTGGQPHPGVGVTATGERTKQILIEDVARSCGADYVEVADSYDVRGLEKIIWKGIEHKGVSVIISRGPCVLRPNAGDNSNLKTLRVNKNKCGGCFLCMTQFGCPAIKKCGDEVMIDDVSCSRCGACIVVCPKNAIEQDAEGETSGRDEGV